MTSLSEKSSAPRPRRAPSGHRRTTYVLARLVVAIGVVVSLHYPTSAAHAQPLAGTERWLHLDLRLDLGAGWDENVFWSLTEDPAHLPPPGLAKNGFPPVTGDGLAAARPRASITYRPGWRHALHVSYLGDLRHYFNRGWAQYHDLSAHYRLHLYEGLFVQAGGGGLGFWRQEYDFERFHRLRAHLRAGWLVPLRWQAWLGYGFCFTRYPDPEREIDGEVQADICHRLELGGTIRLHGAFDLGAGYRASWVDSNKEFHDRRVHRLLLTGRLRLPEDFVVDLVAGLQLHRLPEYHEPGGGTPERRDDVFPFLSALVRWRALSWLDVWASYEIGYLDISWGETDWSERRQVALAGVGVRWRKGWLRQAEDDTLHAARVVSAPGRKGARRPGRWVRFQLEAPDAQRVSVIGSFNGWSARKGRMKEQEGGVWHIRLWLPPGRYLYTFRVDGEPLSRPPGADSYVSDGFGGQNGVLIVER